MKPLPCTVLLLLCAALASIAQEPILFTQRVPDLSQWTIVKSRAKQAGDAAVPASAAPDSETKKPAPPPVLREILVQKSDGNYRQTSLYSDGQKYEYWFHQGLQLMETRNRSSLTRVAPLTPEYRNYADSDFPELSWIKKENSVGEEVFEKVPCQVFYQESDIPVGMPEEMAKQLRVTAAQSGAPASPTKLRAYIAKETRLPVALEINGQMQRYEFGPALRSPLQLPAHFQKAFETWEISIRPPAAPPKP